MSRKLRVGIVSTGHIAAVIADAITRSRHARVSAVSSRRQSAADSFAEPFGAKAFSDWRWLVAWEGIDAVYVATPTAVREQICLAAAGNKKHVLAEKPFASLDSVRRIGNECLKNRVAFMDATHFVHHPRTLMIKQAIAERYGPPQSLHSAFFYPLMDTENVRYVTDMEPMGALADMGWYSMRAITEYLCAGVEVANASVYLQRHEKTGSVIRAAGFLQFVDGKTSSFDVGYNLDVRLMDLSIICLGGNIFLDDFVVDWQKGFIFDNPGHEVGFTAKSGAVTPTDFDFIKTPTQRPPHVSMIDDFAGLAANRDEKAIAASIEVSRNTQRLVDTIWRQGIDTEKQQDRR
uniref:Predicted dehydrogenase n=1 Tax=Candidatus Kentrum sp. LFY TaxID=2126342 RepID=A0A450UFW6_9GAMM|nr:MAG: Predicted dehydrogenase [Candidatus Kentron sp. LFY]VFK01726.1 MAG: Predicted dehydrogenase [Candidatus Kentron sp. LFY]